MMPALNPSTIQLIALGIFAIALVHTFSVKFFEKLAVLYPRHAGVFHLLGEVEVVFGFWASVLILMLFFLEGSQAAIQYADTRNYTEPMFVFVIMVIAATKPILFSAQWTVRQLAKRLPMPPVTAFYFLALSMVPLFGSLITEPAAMTLAALMLRDQVYSRNVSKKLMYATIGVLFVNVSIGGTLTPYAAPPVLMVAAKWNFDLTYMLTHFGWRAALAVFVNTTLVTALFWSELRSIKPNAQQTQTIMPLSVVVISTLFLVGVVVFAHHAAIFMAIFLFFLGYATAYAQYQDRLILREGLMVAFFLAGLVVLGGMQAWWLQPILSSLSPTALYFGATALTAITDNAALTYLGSLVEGLSEQSKYLLVAGAVTGGGLTVIANAPNPAGYSLLKEYFPLKEVSALGLFVAAFPPTVVAIIAFKYLPGPGL
jgi:hypothetical protein